MLIRFTHGKIALLVCLMQVLMSTVNEIVPYSPQRILIFFFVAFECVYAVLIQRKARASWICYMLFWGTVGIFAVLTSSNLMEDVTDTVYMITTVLILELMQDSDTMDQVAQYAAQSRTKIIVILWIALVIIGISALDPANYAHDGAFFGFMYSSHSMASTAIVIMSIVIMCIDSRGGKVKHIICSETLILAISLLIILYTKGRTFLVPAAVLLWRYLKMLPIVKYQRSIIAFCICGLILVLFWNQIVEKFVEAFNNPYAKNTMAAITNFRSELWACDISYVKEESPLKLIFGNGFSFVRELHEDRLHARLWSHNDITYLLIASGLLGLAVYTSVIGRSAVQYFRRKGHAVYFVGMVIFPMLVNGLYIYQPLVWAYFMVVVSQHIRARGEAMQRSEAT